MTMAMTEEECQGGTIVVDVEEDQSTESGTETIQQMVTLSKELCNIGNSVKSDICPAFGKTCITNVQPKDMIGKGNTRISKEYLAEKILTFVNLTTNLNCIVNRNPPVLEVESQRVVSQETAVVKKLVYSFEEKFQKYNSEIESNAKVITVLLTCMQELQQDVKQNRHSQNDPSRPSTGIIPNTVSPKLTPIPICEPFVRHVNNGVKNGL